MKDKAIKCDFCEKDSVDAYQDFNGGKIVYSCNDHHGKAITNLNNAKEKE